MLTATCLALSSALASPQGTALEAGPLVLDFHISRTANLFHAVDQISGWSPFCHSQYLEAFGELDAEDLALLAAHADVRAERPWGQGLEQTFYVSMPLQQALERGVAEGHLSAEQAETEGRVLRHFAQRADALLERERERLEAFEQRIVEERETLSELADDLTRLVGQTPAPIPVFLLANPSENQVGGGFNGGKLTIEVPSGILEPALGTFQHEVTHAFLNLRGSYMARVTDGVDERLDAQTLNEGIAHALSPGIHHGFGENRDPLVERVRWFQEEGRDLADYDLRVHRYGLALRPLVREALEDESMRFEALAQRAVDVWLALAELERAR